MRRRNRYLEDELKKRQTAEKPYEQKEDKAKVSISYGYMLKLCSRWAENRVCVEWEKKGDGGGWGERWGGERLFLSISRCATGVNYFSSVKVHQRIYAYTCVFVSRQVR